MERAVRLLVAGAGAFGCEHLEVLSRMLGVVVAGVADIRSDAAEAAASRFDVAERDVDAGALLERLRPDGLIVATPGTTHVPLATRALALGVPVLVEKPVGLNAAEVEALIEAAAGSRAFVLPGHILRFSDAHRAFVEIAQSDAVGRVISVTARRHRDESHAQRYREDPILMTMIHDIDLALWITGGEPVEVSAHRRPAGLQRSETLVTATDTTGAVWRLATAWTFPENACPPDRIEVVGERGGVELEVGGAIRRYGAEPLSIDVSQAKADQPLAAELAYFAECIRTRRRPDVVTLADAATGLRVADAAIESLRNEEKVRL